MDLDKARYCGYKETKENTIPHSSRTSWGLDQSTRGREAFKGGVKDCVRIGEWDNWRAMKVVHTEISCGFLDGWSSDPR